VAYAGVIQELEHRNLLVNVQRVGGTSAGAIAAMTVSLGYT
jgi:NTE family protein